MPDKNAISLRRSSPNGENQMFWFHRDSQSADAVRGIGVSRSLTIGGVRNSVDETGSVKWMKELEAENARLRRAVSDLTLDKMILAEAAEETSEPRVSLCLHRPCSIPAS